MVSLILMLIEIIKNYNENCVICVILKKDDFFSQIMFLFTFISILYNNIGDYYIYNDNLE